MDFCIQVSENPEEIQYVVDENYVLETNDDYQAMVCEDEDGTKSICVNGQYYILAEDLDLHKGNEMKLCLDEEESQFLVQENENGSILLDGNTEENQVLYYTDGQTENEQQFLYTIVEDAPVVEEPPLLKEEVQYIFSYEGKEYKVQGLDEIEPSDIQFVELVQGINSLNDKIAKNLETFDEEKAPKLTEGNLNNWLEKKQRSDDLLRLGKKLQTPKNKKPSPIDIKPVILNSNKNQNKKLDIKKHIVINNTETENINKLLNSKIKIVNKTETENINELLNTRIKIGKTQKGRALVGRILTIKHAGKNNSEEKCIQDNIEPTIRDELSDQNILENVTFEANNLEEDEYLNENICDPDMELSTEEISENKCIEMPKFKLSYISSTLGRLMNMRSVHEEIADKNIFLAIVEKFMTCKVETTLFGYMEKSPPEGGAWGFRQYENDIDLQIRKHKETTSITLFITYHKDGTKSTKLNLNNMGNMCKICKLHFSFDRSLRAHMKEFHDRLFCDICKNFVDSKNHEHFVTKDAEKEKRRAFSCDQCEKSFSKKPYLKRHNILVHKVPLPKKDRRSMIQENSNDDHLKGIFTCEICSKSFSRHKNLDRHMEIHKGTNSVYKCPFCDSMYKVLSTLTRHLVHNHYAIGKE